MIPQATSFFFWFFSLWRYKKKRTGIDSLFPAFSLQENAAKRIAAAADGRAGQPWPGFLDHEIKPGTQKIPGGH
jgi:hypothetical protein